MGCRRKLSIHLDAATHLQAKVRVAELGTNLQRAMAGLIAEWLNLLPTETVLASAQAQGQLAPPRPLTKREKQDLLSDVKRLLRCGIPEVENYLAATINFWDWAAGASAQPAPKAATEQ